uniref:Uncharacterized protein n=1 Tax=Panagrolaimus davidi TaxID=227884 RepID=A0A914QG26_9BILA
MEKCLFDGKWPKSAAQCIHGFCTCFCGDKIFILGCRKMIKKNRNDPTNFSIAVVPCLTEFSSSSGMSITYKIKDELPGELTRMYSLHGENVLGVIVSSRNPDQIIQLIWKLNQETETIECIAERRFSFQGINHLGIGIGTNDAKCILLMGKSSVENGEVFVVRTIAANPLHTEKYPDKCFDKEIAELEQLCKNHPNELSLFPFRGVPFINENGIYFLLRRIRDLNLSFKTEFIGSIRLTKNGGTKVELINIKENDAVESVRKIVNLNLIVGWCSTQQRTAAWMQLIVRKESGHWRYKLQRWALVLCEMLIRYIGKPLLSLSWLDGGFCGSLFANFYKWLFPGLVPTLGPSSDLILLALDMKDWKFRRVPFQGGETEFRKKSRHICVNSTSDGSLILMEVSTSLPHRMRISRVSNPFRLKPLYEIAFEACTDLMPKLLKNPALLRLQHIYNSGGCILYS